MSCEHDQERSGRPCYFCCTEMGMTMDETHVEQLPDTRWRARAKIRTIFGSEVEGELTGEGATKEEALAALAKERYELSESLWI